MTAQEEEKHLVKKFLDEGMIEFIDEQINRDNCFHIDFIVKLCVEGFMSEHAKRLFEHRQEFCILLERLYKEHSNVYWLVAI